MVADRDDYDADLDAILAALPPDQLRHILEMRRLEQSTHRALMQILKVRMGLRWLLAGNLGLAVVNAIMLMRWA